MSNPRRTIGFTPSASIPIPTPQTDNQSHDTKSPKSDETISNRRSTQSIIPKAIQETSLSLNKDANKDTKVTSKDTNSSFKETTNSISKEVVIKEPAKTSSRKSSAQSNANASSVNSHISKQGNPTTPQAANKQAHSNANNNKDQKQPRARSGSANNQQHATNIPQAQVKKASRATKTKTSSEQKGIQFFAHLPTPNHGKSAKHPIHPSVLTLALQYAQHRVIGSNARTLSMLAAFKRVIQQYQTPENSVLSRTLETYLRPQIDFLTKARPMSIGMGNAIRELKLAITQLPPDLDESEVDFQRHFIARSQSYFTGQTSIRYVYLQLYT
jgi:hypothetical protein